MKLLHKRFKEEGIVINYPVRTLQFPEGWTPEDLLSRNGQEQDGRPSARRRPVKTAANGGNHGRRPRRRRPSRIIHTPLESDLDGGGDGDGPAAG